MTLVRAALPILLCALAFAARAGAQTTAPLTWNAPASCPVASQVLERAREAGLVAALPAWTATASVRRAPRGLWRMEMLIEVSGDRVTQRRAARTCAALAQVAGVDLALVLNAHATPSAAPAAPAPALVVTGVATPRGPVAAPVVPAVDDEASQPVGTVAPPLDLTPRTWRWTASAEAATVFGLLPAANFGIGLRTGVVWSGARVEVGARWFFARDVEATVGGAPAHVADVGAAMFSLRGCGRFAFRLWSFDGCAGVQGGWLDARAAGSVSRGDPPLAPWWGVAVGVEAAWMPTRTLSFGAGIDLAWLLSRPFVTVANLGLVHEAAAVAVTPQLNATLSY